MVEKSDKYASQAKWRKAHMRTISIQVRKEVADKFDELCKGKVKARVFVKLVEEALEKEKKQ
jgi:hypothetical protein